MLWQKIKLILKSVRQYKKYAIITPIFMIFEALLESVLPFIMSIFVDIAINVTDLSDFTTFYAHNKLPFKISLMWLIIVMVIIAMISLLCGIMGGRFGAKAAVGLATNLRSDLYKKIQSFSFSNIDKFSTSSLITRLTTDINNVQMAFQMLIRIVIRAPLMLIFSVIMSFISGGVMALIFIGIGILVIIGLAFIVKNAMKIFTRVFKRYDALNQSVQENITGIRVVKAFVREAFEKDKFDSASDNISFDFIKAEKIIAFNNPLMNTSIHLSNILVVGIGAYIVSKYVTMENGEIKYLNLSTGGLSSLLTYGIQILSSLMMISMILVMFVMSLESIRRIGEVLLEEPQIVNPENPVLAIKDGSVDFNHVNFKYSASAEKNTLTDIDFHVKSGQFIGILGSTGSGKTSVINLISRLYDVTEGEILVGGVNVKNYDLVTLRDGVAVVLQKNVLFSGTIASNLRWGNENATEEEMWAACKIAQAEEIVKGKEEQLNTRVEQAGANFSGGQKQRLCIARAILKNPKILILDDSTSAVDTKTDSLIRTALKHQLPNMTKIVIAQRISSIQDADQIIILDDGHIDAIGNHEELIKSNKIYQEVYYTQNRVGGNE